MIIFFIFDSFFVQNCTFDQILFRIWGLIQTCEKLHHNHNQLLLNKIRLQLRKIVRKDVSLKGLRLVYQSYYKRLLLINFTLSFFRFLKHRRHHLSCKLVHLNRVRDKILPALGIISSFFMYISSPVNSFALLIKSLLTLYLIQMPSRVSV